MIAVFLVIIAILSVLPSSILADEELEESTSEEIIEANTSEEAVSNESIIDVQETWQEISDERLNDAIANSDEDDLSEFLKNLSSEELEEILTKDTMLNNEINIYSPENLDEEISNQEISDTMLYYEYLLNLKTSSKITTMAATAFTTTKGYFFIQISGDGKTTKKKISVTLTSTNRETQQKVTFSEVNVSGYSNNHNFKIVTGTSNTQLTDTYYTIIVLQFSYTKTAHYLAKGSYSDKVDGYRFNFRKYTYNNEGESTVNNTGHNSTNTTETIDVQINAANCGIGSNTSDNATSHATGYITLSKGYYSSLSINPNGGTHNGKTSTYTYGTKVCETTATIVAPTRVGYVFTGWTLSKGSNCSGASFNSTSNVFTYCGKSTSSSGVSSANTCTLTANWKKVDEVLPDAGGIPLDILFIMAGIILITFLKYKKEKQ